MANLGNSTVYGNLAVTGAVTGNIVNSCYTAGGTATAITLTIPGLLNYRVNMLITVIAALSNAGAATTININGLGTISAYKPNTTTAPNLIAGKPYTFYFNGTSFFLQASAEGTAVASQVLTGYTFSNDSDTGIAGSMANNGAVAMTPSTVSQTIAAGYHNGSGTVAALGGTAAASAVLTGNTFSSNTAGRAASGTMTNRSALVSTNGVFTVTGTFSAHGSSYSESNGSNTFMLVPEGYYNGATYLGKSVPNLIQSNVKSGVAIGDVGFVGTFTGGLYASGTFGAVSAGQQITTGWFPDIVMVGIWSGNYHYVETYFIKGTADYSTDSSGSAVYSYPTVYGLTYSPDDSSIALMGVERRNATGFTLYRYGSSGDWSAWKNA